MNRRWAVAAVAVFGVVGLVYVAGRAQGAAEAREVIAQAGANRQVMR